ncbi:MAG: HAD-IA family hydrolase [Acidobacteria bacterium]|nr:HAD-IA family hydrolase [Acidobacteriota bacterium]MBI3658408.1 HAD-IA family hydrolase [Acidobacteriota bacterium]
MKRIKTGLIIFDLDGTLLDSMLDIANSVNAMRGRMGYEELPLSAIYGLIGDGAHLLVQRALPPETPEAERKQGLTYFLEDYRRHMLDHTQLFPGVLETLHALQKKPLAVLTNKLTELTQIMLTKLAIIDYFRYVLGSDKFPRKKPDPMGVLYLLEATQALPNETLMIGDTANDILTGRRAGVLTCGVTYGIGGEKLRAARPDFLIDDLRQLLDINE